jgi:hypothetical protein
MKELNKGVQILIERMNSNPDEFIPDVIGNYPSKWRDTLRDIEYRVKLRGVKLKPEEMLTIPLPFLDEQEIDAVWNKMQQLQGDLFTKKIMNTLLTDTRELSSSFSGNSLSASVKIGKLRYP